MLVCYDQTGMINQCIIQAPVTLEELAARYTEMGVPHLLVQTDSPENIYTHYVKNGEFTPMPVIAVAGENRPIAADGVDMLTFTVETAVKVQVWLGKTLVHEEQVTDGSIEFATDHPGSYRVDVSGEFPWLGTSFVVEAS
jgi:hypothetical protein